MRHTQLASCREIAGQTSPLSKQGVGHPFYNVFGIRYYILSNLWKHLSPFDSYLMWTSNGDPFWQQGGHSLYKALQENVSCKTCLLLPVPGKVRAPEPGDSGECLLTVWNPVPAKGGQKKILWRNRKPCVQTAKELFEWDSPETATQSFGFPQSQQMVSTSLWSLILLSWDERNFSTPEAGSNPPSCL